MSDSEFGRSHVFFGIILLICLISVFKNPFIYFEDYANALQLNDFQYSIILLSLYLGNITSLFFGVYVNNLFKDKYQGIASTFSFISGLLSILFCLISYFNTITSNSISSPIIVIYGSIIAFLYKNCASIAYTTIVGLAAEFSATNTRGKNISYLQLSWSVSTLLYIPIGCILEYSYWYIPFLIFGVILILYTFIISWGFNFKIPAEEESNADNFYKAVSDIQSNFSSIPPELMADISHLRSIFNKQINLILLSIFFCSIAQGSFLITTSSFWMEDIYQLPTCLFSLTTLSIFFAEIVGAIVMTQISDQYGIFKCSFIAFFIEIIASLIILNCSAVIGADIGGLWLAVILNFFLFVGWEMFFITQVLAMIEFGPINVSKNIILLANFATASIAKMIGAELSSWLWFNGNGLAILSAIWLGSNVCGLACYSILYHIRDKRNISTMSEYLPIGDGDNVENEDESVKSGRNTQITITSPRTNSNRPLL